MKQGGCRALLVVSGSGIDQHGVRRGLDYPGVDALPKQAAFGIEALLAPMSGIVVQRLYIALGEELGSIDFIKS